MIFDVKQENGGFANLKVWHLWTFCWPMVENSIKKERVAII